VLLVEKEVSFSILRASTPWLCWLECLCGHRQNWAVLQLASCKFFSMFDCLAAQMPCWRQAVVKWSQNEWLGTFSKAVSSSKTDFM